MLASRYLESGLPEGRQEQSDSVSLFHSLENPFRGERSLEHTHTYGVINRIRNRRHRAVYRNLADRFRAERAALLERADYDCFHLR